MSLDRPNIFVIDDDRIYQFAAKKTIEATGLAEKVMIFSNGEEAIHYLKKNAADGSSIPDIIFLDINMPVMNGWQFLEEYAHLRSDLQKNITIYMVSSSVDEYDIRKSKEFKTVSDYIIKPIQKEKFSQVLSSYAE